MMMMMVFLNCIAYIFSMLMHSLWNDDYVVDPSFKSSSQQHHIMLTILLNRDISLSF